MAFASVNPGLPPVVPSLPKSSCPVCDKQPELRHERSEHETITVVTFWCPLGHMWEVRWSVAA